MPYFGRGWIIEEMMCTCEQRPYGKFYTFPYMFYEPKTVGKIKSIIGGGGRGERGITDP